MFLLACFAISSCKDGIVATLAGSKSPAENPAEEGDPTETGASTNGPNLTAVRTNKADGVYGVGEIIDITVHFSEKINVTDGVPSFKVETGTSDQTATFIAKASDKSLLFRYTVSIGDSSADLDVSDKNNTIALNGARIVSSASGNGASLVIPPGSLSDSSNIVIDALAPNPGEYTVEIEDITTTTLRIDWNAANDDRTAAEDLEYKMVYSTSDDITTIADANLNGTVGQAYTANSLSISLSSLTPATTYYVAVLIKDEMGNESILGTSVLTESFCGGDGSSGDPWQVCSLGDLHSIRDDLSAFYIINNDIDASPTSNWNDGQGWMPIGSQASAFSGGLNGGNKVIRGLTINRPNTNYVGLFGSIVSSNTFELMGMLDVNVTGQSATGAFAGLASTGTFRYLYSTGNVSVKPSLIYKGGGGLVGQLNANLQYSFSTADVVGRDGSGDFGVGGLVGVSGGAYSISHCYATGRVSGVSTMGGLIGQSGSTVNYSFATGDVLSDSVVGGLIGFSTTGATTHSHNYAQGNAYSTGSGAAGLAGSTYSSHSYSISDGHVSGNSNTGGFAGYDNGLPTYSYNISTGKVIGSKTFTSGTTATYLKNISQDWGDGLPCGSGGTTDCIQVNTGYTKPFAFRFSQELEYVQMKYEEDTPVNLRKISYADQSAYRVWGSCTSQDAQINISLNDGSTVANTTTTCRAFSWEKFVDASTLDDGPVTITADQAGASTRTLNLTKETSYCSSNPSNGDFAAGDGSSGTPYLICTPSQFDKLRSYLGANTYFKLMNNLDLSSDFSGTIGNDLNGDCTSRWCGILNGNGFVLRNIYINTPNADYTGLFGYTDDPSSEISELGIENINMIAGVTAGGLIGFAERTAVTDVYIQGNIISAGDATEGHVGGMLGSGYMKLVMNGAYANVNITHYSTGATKAGGMNGVVGRGAGATVNIDESESHGTLLGINTSAMGGFTGYSYGTGTTFINSFATGHVTGSTYAMGGMMGMNMHFPYNLLATGTVINSNNRAGGIAGVVQGGSRSIKTSINTGHVISPSGVGGGIVGNLNNNTGVHVEDTVAVGLTLTGSGTAGGVAGIIVNAAGARVLTSYYFLHTSAAPQCIGADNNAGDNDTCNDGGTGLNYATFSNFTSATDIYAGFDLSNVWKFPSGGGTPILDWQYEP